MKFFTTVFHALGIASEVFASYCDYHDVLGGSSLLQMGKYCKDDYLD